MTSFDKRMQEEFNPLTIKTQLCKNKKQYYADYIELVSLITSEFVSQSDIIDRLSDEGVIIEIEDQKMENMARLILWQTIRQKDM